MRYPSLIGKVEGKSARGKQRMTCLNKVKYSTNTTNGSDLIHACKDRRLETYDRTSVQRSGMISQTQLEKWNLLTFSSTK